MKYGKLQIKNIKKMKKIQIPKNRKIQIRKLKSLVIKVWQNLIYNFVRLQIFRKLWKNKIKIKKIQESTFILVYIENPLPRHYANFNHFRVIKNFVYILFINPVYFPLQSSCWPFERFVLSFWPWPFVDGLNDCN